MADDAQHDVTNNRKKSGFFSKIFIWYIYKYVSEKSRSSNASAHHGQPRQRPLLKVQTSFSQVAESTFAPPKNFAELEKGYILRGKASKDSFCIIGQCSPFSYTASKMDVKGSIATSKSSAIHYVRIEPMDSSGSPSQLKVSLLKVLVKLCIFSQF